MRDNYLQTQRSALPLTAQIEVLLRSRGVMSAAEIISATGKSQQLVSIALRSLGASVYKLGAARATRYALTKPILGLSATQVLQLTDEAGNTAEWGTLTQLYSSEIHVRSIDGASWLVPPNTLPWFLAPLRPDGFLARALRGLRPDLPDDPALWTVEQALYPAIMHHSDPPGAFSIGKHIGRIRTLAASGFEIRGSHYDMMADTVGKTLPAHSSAGGEQPKFVTEYTLPSNELVQYVVKFSPPLRTPFGERWRALLHLENLANQVLGEQGIAVAKTNIVESAVRTYLESERFDRAGVGPRPRAGGGPRVHPAIRHVRFRPEPPARTARGRVVQSRPSVADAAHGNRTLPLHSSRFALGRVTANLVPDPTALVTRTWPRIPCTRCLTIASPKPVPPISRDLALSTR